MAASCIPMKKTKEFYSRIGAKGGKRSKRIITSEQQRKMQAGRPTSSCGCARPQPRPSPIFHGDGSVSIPLTRGMFARIDEEDFERVSQRTWYVSGKYAVSGKRGEIVRLHNFLVHPPAGLFNDHISRDRFDNRKSNLRFCTNQQNSCNRKLPITNTSGHRGVTWVGREQMWSASIGSKRRRKHLGYFSDKNDAAKAYKEAAVRLHGEFAQLD